MKNSKVYLNELLDQNNVKTPQERQLCSKWFNLGVNYALQDKKQVAALFKPKQENTDAD